jgi:hypothetical protein
MIPDRIIEPGTLTVQEGRASIEVRMPWYRALPASCIAGFELSIDGRTAPAETLRCVLNGAIYRPDELLTRPDEWWFPVDSLVLSGDIDDLVADGEHRVEVAVSLYIPYIILDGDETLRIAESDTKTMEATTA